MSVFGFVRRTTQRLYTQLQEAGTDAEKERAREALRATTVFGACSSRTLGALASAMHPRTYQPGEVIYHEGDPGLGLYVVEEGQVRLCADWEHDRTDMRIVESGGLFGALSLAGDFRRMETAEAITTVRVYGLFRPDLSSLNNRHPHAAIEALQTLNRLMARQYIDLIDVIADRDGDEVALQSYAEASARATEAASSRPT
ncbi:MAG: cyclic nucleotide-binding domain-containing protein [Longimonas sp.]|uniref:Crp/Fnr family transcriptional regulator n=1 Tax=Longimonas sp. TaxID=2039626 RepID=UPI00335D688E